MSLNTVKSVLAQCRPQLPYRPSRARESAVRRFKRWAVLAIAGTLLTACGSDTFEVPEGFFGAVVAEEPRAALLARDAIVTGGSAADAAVVMYFTLAATLPSSAGLAATGSCAVHDPETSTFQRLDFLPRPSADSPNALPLPLGPRAMFALHARHGTKPFEELIIEAERLARFGDPVSRALATDLSTSGTVLGANPAAARVFQVDGRALNQGQLLTQIELAATLSRLRSEGVGSLYSGPLAADWIDATRDAGFAIDTDRLRAALPQWQSIEGVAHSNHRWGIAAPTVADIRLGEAALGLILDGADWKDGDDAERAHLLAEALNRATVFAATDAPVAEDALETAMAGYDADRRGLSAPMPRLAETLGTDPTRSPGATAFFAVDRRGLAVGCAISMGTPFGTGQVASPLGVLLASGSDSGAAGAGAFSLVVSNTNTGQVHMLVSGSGGRPALSSVIQTALDHWELRVPIEEATARPRSHFAGGANTLTLESATPTSLVAGLRERGYAIAETEVLGTASAFRCVEGLPRREIRCGAGPDARSLGLMLFEFGAN